MNSGARCASGALMTSFRRDPRRAVGVVVVDGGGEEVVVMVGEEEGDERKGHWPGRDRNQDENPTTQILYIAFWV